MKARALVAGLIVVSGCVFPADDPTGLELSWRFLEVNDVDGEGTARLRSCQGAGADRVVFEIVDADDPSRRGSFDYPCSDGFQTPAEFSTEASDAFVDLKPGRYEVTVNIVGPDETQRVRSFETDILTRSPTTQALDLAFEPTMLTLTLENAESCAEAAVQLHYIDPELDLALPERDEEGTARDIVYRAELRSDRALSLGGEPSACADLAGDHTFTGLDQGRYRLVWVVDGQACTMEPEVALGSMGANTVIDLANLECDG